MQRIIDAYVLPLSSLSTLSRMVDSRFWKFSISMMILAQKLVTWYYIDLDKETSALGR